jgi:hypothetical protein
MTAFNHKKRDAAFKVREALKAYRDIGGKFVLAQVEAMEAIFNVEPCSDDPTGREAVAYCDDMIGAHNAYTDFMAGHAMRSIEGTWAGEGFRSDAYRDAMGDLEHDYFPTADTIHEEYADYAQGQRDNARVDAARGK